MPNIHDFLSKYCQAHQIPQALEASIQTIAQACIAINQEIRQGALAGILGSAGSGNVQGEEQKKLDVRANEILIDALKQAPSVAGLASEEEEHFIACAKDGEYLVLFDPLDGSSNIDVNISVGTIFSILAKPDGELNEQSFLQEGNKQIAAGYALYGPQTQFVITLNHNIFAFTLNRDNVFILTQSNPKIPADTQEFAINMSNQRHWQLPIQRYINDLLSGDTGPRQKNYNMRWIASMVAEVHRILMRGGVFLYPQDGRLPRKPGKLRLMYEANPLGLIIQNAGGQTSNGTENLLNIVPESLHQRVAVILGSKEEVAEIETLHRA